MNSLKSIFKATGGIPRPSPLGTNGTLTWRNHTMTNKSIMRTTWPNLSILKPTGGIPRPNPLDMIVQMGHSLGEIRQ